LETIRTEESDLSATDGETNGENGVDAYRKQQRVDDVSDARLVQLFSRPRAPRELIAGLRVLGFTASSVEFMTGARSRDVVYSWAAGRARPGMEQAARLDEIRRILHFICAHPELGPDSAWMLFNAKFGTMSPEGPTAMELIAQGDAADVLKHVESLVDDGGEEGGESPPEPEPSPPPDTGSRKQPAASEG